MLTEISVFDQILIFWIKISIFYKKFLKTGFIFDKNFDFSEAQFIVYFLYVYSFTCLIKHILFMIGFKRVYMFDKKLQHFLKFRKNNFHNKCYLLGILAIFTRKISNKISKIVTKIILIFEMNFFEYCRRMTIFHLIA